MDCQEFSHYVVYCLPEYQTDMPTEARLHRGGCLRCRELCEAFLKYVERTAQEAEERGESLWRRLRGRFRSNPWGERIEVSCSTARPFIPQIAEPLELTPPPDWLDDHLEVCQDCRQELARLDELSRMIAVAEMPVLVRVVIADSPPEFMEKVYKLRAIRPEDITCEQAEAYYPGMARCDLESPAPGEIYRHVRNCTLCKDRVRDLRYNLGISIPEHPYWSPKYP